MRRTSRRLLAALVTQCRAAAPDVSPGWRHCCPSAPRWALLTSQRTASTTSHAPHPPPPVVPTPQLQLGTPETRPRRPVGPQSSPLAINAALVGCTTAEDVLATVALCGHVFNDVNSSTAFYRLARCLRDAKTVARRRLGSQAATAVASDARTRSLEAHTSRLLARHSFGDRCMASTLWSVAVLHGCGVTFSDSFVSELGNRAYRRLGAFSEHSLANAAYAAACLRFHGASEFVHACWRASRHSFPGFAPQGIANLLWATATTRTYPGAAAVDTLMRHFCLRAGEFKHIEVGQMAWALAEMKHRPPRAVFDALDARAADQALDITPQALSSLLWACCVLGHVPSRTLAALGEPDAAARCASLFQLPTPSTPSTPAASGSPAAQDASLIAFSCAMLGCFDTPLFKAAWQAAGAMGRDAFAAEGYSMLFQTMLLAQAAHAELADAASGGGSRSRRVIPRLSLPPGLHAQCEATWRAAVARPTVSELHSSVADCLATLGIPHQLEGRTADGLLSIDIAIHCDALLDAGTGQPVDVAIEVDGPSHFAVNSNHALGRTRARNALLRCRGWRVVQVPFFEWNTVKHGQPQLAYLRRRLEQEAGLLIVPQEQRAAVPALAGVASP